MTDNDAGDAPEAEEWRHATLDQIRARCWQRIARAASDPSDPMRTVVLATARADGPAARHVVLRFADPASRRIACHTEVRTAKVAELRAQPRAAWLLYDAGTQTQIRLRGATRPLTGASDTGPHWAAVAPASYANYLTQRAPGTPLPAWSTDLPENVLHGGATDADVQAARRHFTVLETRVDEIDWVQLDPRGNGRAVFRWLHGRWVGRWVVP